MSNYFLDVTLNTDGHSGTDIDPWSFNDLLATSVLVALDVVSIRGEGSFVASSDHACFHSYVIFDKWIGLWGNEPWRLQIDTRPALSADFTQCCFKNGIFSAFTTSSIFYFGTDDGAPEYAHENTIFIIEYGSANHIDIKSQSINTATFLGCTILSPDRGTTINAQASNPIQFINCILHSAGFSSSGMPVVGAAVVTNCVVFHTPFPNIFIYVDSQNEYITAPVWPTWNAPKEDWSQLIITTAMGIQSPPEPGHLPYTEHETDAWGNTRTGIGSLYMGVEVTTTPVPTTTTTTPPPGQVFYVNAGSSSPAAPYSTINTGAHNFIDLMNNVSFGNNATIEVVDDGLIDNSASPIIIPPILGVVIRSHSSNVNKPTIKLRSSIDESTMALFYSIQLGWIKIYNINFTCDDQAYIKIEDTGKNGSSRCEISGCTFNKSNLDINNVISFFINNNIFKNIGNNVFHQCLRLSNGLQEVSICNNTFFNTLPGNNDAIQIYGRALNLKVFNNIFDTISRYGLYYDNGGHNDSTVNIDYNIDHNCSSGAYAGHASSYLGLHNISADPMFTNPSSEDLTLQTGSPCIDVGVDNAIESTVPLIDIIGTTRPQGLRTDAGVYEKIQTPTTIAPVFDVQPTNESAIVGTEAQFDSIATGIPTPEYQWYKGATALIDDSRISGSTTRILTINPTISTDAGSYHVVAFNGVLPNATSNNVNLTIVPETIYYVNAESTVEDGLTPDTGYHTMTTLFQNITVVDNDVVEIVNNGIVDESVFGELFLPAVKLKIRSYSGNIEKPLVKIMNMFAANRKQLKITNIKFTTETTLSARTINFDDVGNGTYLENCEFWSVFVSANCDATYNPNPQFFVRNCIFKNSTTNTFQLRILSQIQCFINNNLFFNGTDNFITIQNAVAGSKILNNIFNKANKAINGGQISTILIDYNLDYEVTTAYFHVPPTALGANNIRNTDPQFNNISEFLLTINSPCIQAGVNNNLESSVPTTDANGATRPEGIYTDIGPNLFIINFEYGYPQISSIEKDNVTVLVKTSLPSTAYFVVVSEGDDAPTSLQVTQGKNARGSNVAHGFSGRTVTVEHVEKSLEAENLKPGTAYDIYITTISSGILQSSPSKLSFITIPVIASQRNEPKVYVNDIVSITLNGLIVITSELYPDQFSLSFQSGNGYTIVSYTKTSVKVQIMNDKSKESLRYVPISVSDGTHSSAAYNYKIHVIQGEVQKTIPIGYSVSKQ